jgi:translation initiation factor eIF-2B subunit delta
MVVVGADAVLADGSVLNKCGTNLMALSANYHNVPVYVCAETFKQSANNHYELEKMDPNELKVNIAGVSVSNTYFEKVPVDLITAWVN